MKIAIVGSREFHDLGQVRTFVLHLTPGTTVVSGGAKGVDSMAESTARDRKDLPEPIIYPADWAEHGKAAGFIRNAEIVAVADKVIAFWDGESKGTKNTIDLTLKAKKNLVVVFP